MDEKRLQAHVERLAIFVDRGVEMSEPDLRVAQFACQRPINGSRGLIRIARSIGLRLFVAAEGIFGDGARLIEHGEIRIDGESGVGGAEGFAGPTRQRLR